MYFKSSEPLVLVNHGHYMDSRDRTQPMVRANGTPVEWIEVIGADQPLGTPVTQLPCAEGVVPPQIENGSLVSLDIHLRTEAQAKMGRNGQPYTATAVKQRVTAIEVKRGAPKPAAA